MTRYEDLLQSLSKGKTEVLTDYVKKWESSCSISEVKIGATPT